MESMALAAGNKGLFLLPDAVHHPPPLQILPWFAQLPEPRQDASTNSYSKMQDIPALATGGNLNTFNNWSHSCTLVLSLFEISQAWFQTSPCECRFKIFSCLLSEVRMLYLVTGLVTMSWCSSCSTAPRGSHLPPGVFMCWTSDF